MHRSLVLAAALGGSILAARGAPAAHPLPGPHVLECEVAGSAVRLSWDELGIGDGSIHEARLFRGETLLAALHPLALSHEDRYPPPGLQVYRLDIVERATGDVVSTVSCEADVPEQPEVHCDVFGGIAQPPQVLVSWDAVPPGIPIDSLAIYRDGEPVAELPADALSFQEEPIEGEHRYAVVARTEDDPPEEVLVGGCTAIWEPPVIGGFIRGDSDSDGHHDLADAIRIVLHLFAGGEGLPCLSAADANDSGAVDLSDAIYVLGYLFLGAGAPPPPFPECGHDGTPDELGCEWHPPCHTPPPP